MKWFVAFAATLALSGCFRDGYECATADDCFGGESCVAGACQAQSNLDAGADAEACRPASDQQLCDAQEPCQANLQVTDSCGVLRDVSCECPDECVPDTVDVLCEAAGAECGEIQVIDQCEDVRTPNCGLCTAPESCVNNKCSSCAAPECPGVASCGSVVNSCGDVTECGPACPGGQICVNLECVAPVLTSPDVEDGDRFGEEIKADGEWLAVGAPGATVDGLDGAGTIIVFRKVGDGWLQDQVIDSPIPVADGGFGSQFDMRGDLLVARSALNLVTLRRQTGEFEFVGAQVLADPVGDVGLLDNEDMVFSTYNMLGEYTLNFGTCRQVSCSGSFDWEPPNQFDELETLGLGYSIDTAGSRAIIGAPTDNVTRNDFDFLADGSVYFVDRNAEDGKWLMSEWATSDLDFYRWFDWRNMEVQITEPPVQWGRSVVLREDGFAAAGAPLTTPEGGQPETGETFFWAPNPTETLRHTARLRGTNLSHQRCGQSVGLSGAGDNTIAIVACVMNVLEEDAGGFSTVQRERTSGLLRTYRWRIEQQEWNNYGEPVLPPSPSLFDHFGWVIESTPTTIYVGAPGRQNDRGEVYIYSYEELAP